MEGSFILKLTNVRSKLKKSLLIGGSSLVLIATPLSAGAHGWHGNDRGRDKHDNNRYSQRHDKDNDRDKHRRSRKNSRWWMSQEKCQAWQERFNQRVDSFKESAEKDLDFINRFYTMSQTFANEQNVTFDDRESLEEKIVRRQDSATEKVANVEAPDLNCEEDDGVEQSMVEESDDDSRVSLREAEKALKKYDKVVDRFVQHIQNSYDSQVS